ncbi:MAG: acetate--CoA ligase [Ferrovum sp.]|nr:acetate--CoA ligase [Ferrovum sp.]NDU87228.1 acetate--CoA ligase [Ferrovum sp.]
MSSPVLHHERRFFPPAAEWAERATISGTNQHQALCAEAAQDPQGFWGRLAQEHLVWHKPFATILDDSTPPFYRWFTEGQLNASYLCLDHPIAQGHGHKTALIFEADDGTVTTITYQALHQRVCRFANALKSLGVQRGDRVIIYIAMSIEGIIAMQACARIGAIHSVVFGGFSAKSLHERIVDTGASLVITADGQYRGGKMIPLKIAVDEALALEQETSVKNVIVYARTGEPIPWNSTRDLWMHTIEADQSDTCEPTWVDAEHPLFILYTSGSTGKPKGIQHATAGYLLWAILTMKWVFDYHPDDIYWCTADIGWITGHTYVNYGPLAIGATQVIYEGVPSYPDSGRFWSMIARHRVSIFYTAPTAIRSLIKASNLTPHCHPQHYDLSSLRLLGTVGEPINPEAWMWYYQEVGQSRCPIVDTFWQTETGGHVIAPLPGAVSLVPGSCTLPLPGIDATVVDESGHEVAPGHGGLLVIRRPWPAMMRTLWGNPERFQKTYFPAELKGYYLAGDGAVRDEHTGYFTITGRIDDVLNVSGHRLGTMEVESALVAHPLVAEAAVVGKPDDVTGEAIVAFVVLKQARPAGELARQQANELRQWVGQEIGPIAKPREIRFGDNLPKTRSGKIMRRLLRSLARGEALTQDTSTLENPAILEQLQETL